MSKKVFAILIALVIVLGVSSSLVLAKNDKVGEIPEEDGIYDVPGHPELKVRVFVHKVKPASAPAPTLQCGLTDPDSISTVSSAGWHLPANWVYNLNPNNVPAFVGSVNWPVIASNSFKVWTGVVKNQVNITQGPNATINRKAYDGKNIIAWGTAPASALGVTYIWYYPSTGLVAEVDTIMNKKFSWAWSTSIVCAYVGAYDAQNILTHELGHWMGLDDEYTANFADNTMYGYGSTWEVKKDTLTTGDILGVQVIY